MPVTWNPEGFSAKVRAAALRVCYLTAQEVVEHGVTLIDSPPKTGRIYVRYHPKRVHQASAPGQAPAGDLGFLAQSGHAVVPAQNDPLRVSALATFGASYAIDLELGTERMAPRPYLRVSLDMSSPAFLERMRVEMGAIR